MREKQQSNEMVRILEWITENQDMWADIHSGENLSAVECNRIIQVLDKENFYPLIFVLLSRNLCNAQVDRAVTTLVLEKVSESWGKKTKAEIVKEVQRKLVQVER